MKPSNTSHNVFTPAFQNAWIKHDSILFPVNIGSLWNDTFDMWCMGEEL